MNKITHLKHSIIALLGIALLSISCSRDGSLDVLENREVSFSVNSEAISTKITPANNSTITASPFGVIAYSHAAGAAADAWTLHGTESTVTHTSGAWIPNPRVYWPAKKQKVSYLAYWPKIANNSVTFNAVSKTADVRIKNVIANQIDFLVAKATDLDDNPSITALNVPLSFNHVLCGIRFKCNDNVTISKVVISGIKNKGTYDFTTDSWINPIIDGSNSYTLNNITYDDPVEGYKAFNIKHTLFMLPQQLTTPAKISVTVDGKPDVITASMEGHMWDPGKIITYLIKETLAGITIEILEIKDFADYPDDIVFGQPDIDITPINEENDYGGILM
ncbi:MAG: fimbrillin family protein [Bacteroidales bacterium]|nr:fimbrillin family protein [Bacteroidales bacterium]